MTFDELWKMIDKKNPMIKTGIVRLTSVQFKRAMRLAYDKGAEWKAGEDLFKQMFK